MKRTRSAARMLGIGSVLFFIGSATVAPAAAGEAIGAAAAASAGPKHYAVIAACSRYETPKFNIPKFPARPFSDEKLLVLYEALLQSRNWDASRIILLVNENATKEKITAALGLMARTVGPDDYFLFSWSGHGTDVPDIDGDESAIDPGDARDEAICPHDIAKINGAVYNTITDDELNQYFSAITCKAMTLIFDCCLSGGLADRNTAKGAAAGKIDAGAAEAFTRDFKKKIEKPRLRDANAGNRVVLMSTQPDYVERGIFLTGFPLMKGMAIACAHPALADRNKDAVISAEEAFSIARPLVSLQSSLLWLGFWLYSYCAYASSMETGAFAASLIDTSLAFLILQLETMLVNHHFMGNFPIIKDDGSSEFPLIEL